MRALALAAALLAPALAAPALADPVGTYLVGGSNPGAPEATYEGTVEVVRAGPLYEVTWTIDETVYHGTAMGGRVIGERFVIGPASEADTVLAIAWEDGTVVMYAVPGGFAGEWIIPGSTAMGQETWQRLE